jgi:hypothetical protein
VAEGVTKKRVRCRSVNPYATQQSKWLRVVLGARCRFSMAAMFFLDEPERRPEMRTRYLRASAGGPLLGSAR